ncbi:MAG TPA: hypothetical protein VF695_07615 [Sphingomonas sp.]|jgi:hypothetical protein
MRTAIGIIVGIIVAMATIWVMEAGTHLLYPTAPMDLNDPEGVKRIVAGMPVPAKLLILLGWLIGAAAGAFTAVTVARRAWASWVPAGVVFFAGVANLFLIPHPWWMNIGAVTVPILGGWLGRKLALDRLARTSP